MGAVLAFASTASTLAEPRFEEETWSLGLAIWSAENGAGAVAEGAALLQMACMVLFCLVAGLIPNRRVWMAAIPLGFLAFADVLVLLASAPNTFWWLEGVQEGWFDSDQLQALVVPSVLSWSLRFPFTLGSLGLVALAGVRLRRPLGSSGLVALVAAILASLTLPGLVSVLLRLALGDGSHMSEQLWLVPAHASFAVVVLGSAVLAIRAPATRWAALALLVLTAAWQVGFVGLVIANWDAPWWVSAPWGVRDFLRVLLIACMGLALGQEERFEPPERD